jgi:hypothetical protein
LRSARLHGWSSRAPTPATSQRQPSSSAGPAAPTSARSPPGRRTRCRLRRSKAVGGSPRQKPNRSTALIFSWVGRTSDLRLLSFGRCRDM